jgi:hypothetical protein
MLDGAAVAGIGPVARYVAEEDVYICPAGERLAYRYTNEENGLVLHRGMA